MESPIVSVHTCEKLRASFPALLLGDSVTKYDIISHSHSLHYNEGMKRELIDCNYLASIAILVKRIPFVRSLMSNLPAACRQSYGRDKSQSPGLCAHHPK